MDMSAQSEMLEQFYKMIDKEYIYSVYQPIISLQDGDVMGYEALTRGPKDSPFHSPLTMFQFAEQQGELYMLEQLAREKAIKGSILEHPQHCFLSIFHPKSSTIQGLFLVKRLRFYRSTDFAQAMSFLKLRKEVRLRIFPWLKRFWSITVNKAIELP